MHCNLPPNKHKQTNKRIVIHITVIVNIKHIHSTSTHRGDDVGGGEGNVLDTRAAVVFHKLLNLTLSLAIRGLVDGHFHCLVIISHHNGAKRTVLGVHLRVIHRPEAVELQHLHIPVRCRHHLLVGLVADLEKEKDSARVSSEGVSE